MANVTDSFNRADSSTGIGTADSGQSWVNQGGTWGISSNQAFTATAAGDGQSTAVVDSGESDGTVSAIMATLQTDNGLCFRVVDNSNYLMVTVSFGSSIIIYERVAGGFTSLGSQSTTVVNGDLLSVVMSGSAIDIKVNGSTVKSITTTRFQTATKHGLRNFESFTPRWDDFNFTGAGAAATPDMSFLHRMDRQRALRGRRVARSSRTRRQA